MWGHSCLSLAIDIVDWSLVLSASDLESKVLGEEELGFCVKLIVVGEEGSNGVVLQSSVVICEVPLKETRCVSSLFKHNSACGRGPEMQLNWALDGLVGSGLV